MTTQRYENPFSGAWLERRSESRADAGWVAQALGEPGTQFLVSCGTQHLVRRSPETRIAFLDRTHPLVSACEPEQLVLLGWFSGARCVLIDALPDTTGFPADTQLAELRPLLTELPEPEAAVLACARALLIWRARHRHCGVCGAPTRPRSAGHSLQCTSSECGAEFFPRIDPAIIVLVSDGDQALLGRQRGWPAGRYSTLAGFVEPGESLEDTVAREVYEEAGVRVHTISYVASQPWPFPSSLMLGFHATASSAAPIRLDGELEHARWFTAAELGTAGASVLPPPYTIARRLIDTWYLRTTGANLDAA
jgi:NAD+ diphosphatase